MECYIAGPHSLRLEGSMDTKAGMKNKVMPVGGRGGLINSLCLSELFI